MKKALFLSLLSIGLWLHLSAQAEPVRDTLPLADTAAIQTDSIALDESMLADLRFLLDSMKIRQSFFSVDMGVSNRLFSVRNNNFNAQQVTADRNRIHAICNLLP